AGRSPREKGMLLAAVVFLFSVGYYVLIWQPLSERIEQQETMLQQLVAMNTRLKNAAPDIIAARKSATTTPAQVSRVISDSASAHSVVIKRIAERGENIQVWIEPVVFNDLLKWLNALDEKYALRVTQIDVSAAEKTGMVNVQRLEFGRG
ncbi:general secretion pathway protein, partial [Escherichia coli]